MGIYMYPSPLSVKKSAFNNLVFFNPLFIWKLRVSNCEYLWCTCMNVNLLSFKIFFCFFSFSLVRGVACRCVSDEKWVAYRWELLTCRLEGSYMSPLTRFVSKRLLSRTSLPPSVCVNISDAHPCSVLMASCFLSRQGGGGFPVHTISLVLCFLIFCNCNLCFIFNLI